MGKFIHALLTSISSTLSSVSMSEDMRRMLSLVLEFLEKNFMLGKVIVEFD